MREEVFEYLAANEDRHWWHVGKYACALGLLRRFHPEGKRVLEIGASFGSLSRRISEFGTCVAFDLSREALSFGGYPIAVCGDATLLPFHNESYDLVVALDILEHLENDRACLEEVMRVLRPDGKALFFVPACPILWSDLDRINHHYRRYTKSTLLRLCSGIRDMEILKLSYFNFLLFLPILLIRLAQRAAKKRWNHLSTASMKAPPAPVNALLKKLFLLEGNLVTHINLPAGVSLILAARKAASE